MCDRSRESATKLCRLVVSIATMEVAIRHANSSDVYRDGRWRRRHLAAGFAAPAGIIAGDGRLRQVDNMRGGR